VKHQKLKRTPQTLFQRHLQLGKCWIARKEYQRADYDLTQAVALASTDAERADTLYHRGYALLFAKEVARAVQDLEALRALKLTDTRAAELAKHISSRTGVEVNNTQLSLL